MKTRRIKCCYKCTERVLHCHSICPRYLSERKKLDEENDKIFRAKCQLSYYYSRFKKFK